MDEDVEAAVQALLRKRIVGNIIDITDTEDQLRLSSILPRNISFEDVTDNIELPARWIPPATRTFFLVGEGVFKSGRIYRARPLTKPSSYYTQAIAQQLDVTALDLSSSTAEAQRKKGVYLFLAFWNSAARSAYQTAAGSERTITLVARYNPPNRQIRDGTVQSQVSIDFMLYQVNSSVNPASQLAGTLVVFLPDAVLPQYFELNLDVSVPGGAPTTICDCIMGFDVE